MSVKEELSAFWKSYLWNNFTLNVSVYNWTVYCFFVASLGYWLDLNETWNIYLCFDKTISETLTLSYQVNPLNNVLEDGFISRGVRIPLPYFIYPLSWVGI